MRSEAPALVPYLRSDNQARILADVLLGGEDRTLTEIAEATGVPLPTVQREVERLSVAGVLETRKQGRNRLVSADATYPLLAPLTQIVASSYGPAPVVKAAFTGMQGLEQLLIFGSWAARLHGVPGTYPGDIDVLLIGVDISKIDAYRRAESAREHIGREVNPTVVTPERWHTASDGFIQEVRARPYIDLEVAHDNR